MEILLRVYGYGFLAAALVENILYIRNEGFVSWLIFGELVATLKAAIWPFTVLQALLA